MVSCAKCGEKLNNWNAYCPSCGTEAPVTQTPVKNSTVNTGTAEASTGYGFFQASIICWLLIPLMTVLLPVHYVGGRYGLFLSNIGGLSGLLIEIVCSLAIIGGIILSARNERPEIILLPLGFYWIVAAVHTVVFFGGMQFSGWTFFAYLALRLFPIALFIMSIKGKINIKAVWGIITVVVLVWSILYFNNAAIVFQRMQRYMTNAFGLGVTFGPGAITDLVYYAGTALLCAQVTKKA
jgi:hypothetical protein